MEKEISKRHIRLGIFVTAGVSFIILMLYMIGSNRNLFSSNFEISAVFNNVNGLMPGNNVRLSGIDVGTVRRIEITSDSSVEVYMIINKKMRKFIRKNSIASIGTDGLMGSKLVNINSANGASDIVNSGDVLGSLKPIESDEMLRTLNTTNLNLARITTDMRIITHKLNSSQSLWNILQDSIISENFRSSIEYLEETSKETKQAVMKINLILHSIYNGNGLLATVIHDSILSNQLKSTVSNLNKTTEKIHRSSNSLNTLTEKYSNSSGTINLLFMDTLFKNEIKSSVNHINSATEKIDEDLDALRKSFLLRRYFKKQSRIK